jgi:outer membrane protein OmpA-like peptidoglycan-associated protein
MKKLQILGMGVAAMALLVPFAAQAADAPSQGWYAGLDNIVGLERNADTKADGDKDIIKYNAGWGVSGSGGYAFGNGLRTEGELAYRRNQVNSITGAGAGTTNDGHLRNLNAMANVLYDFTTGTRLTPYIGAGAGGALVDAENIRTVDGVSVNKQQAEFAYQGIVGVAVALDKNWSFTTDYRYVGTTDPSLKSDTGEKVKTQDASHNILIGIRYQFGHAEPAPAPEVAQPAPAPVPAPAPAAKVAVPAVPQSYMVFFDFDKSVLTPEAKRIIAAAAQDLKSGKYVRVVVTGHTDTKGTATYNQKLSERRATAVAKEFESLGVPAAEIKQIGAGKAGLLVPTADGVREAQNRRAEIVFDTK